MKLIYGSNLASKVLKGSEMVLFPNYIRLDGIVGFGVFFTLSRNSVGNLLLVLFIV